jgi:hypothetical protein
VSQLKWGRLVRTRLATKSGIGVGFLKAQLSLLEVVDNSDRAVAASALHQLGGLMDARSYRADAAGAYRRLRDEFGDVVVDETRTGRQVVADLPPESLLVAEITTGAKEAWPTGSPKITVQKHAELKTRAEAIPVHAPAGSLYDRLSVSIITGQRKDRPFWKTRFQGDGHRSYWEIELPESASAFRSTAILYRGWGLGHLLVLQVGTELFGISALNDNGEPHAKIEWRLDTLGNRTLSWNDVGVRVRPPRIGFGVETVDILDRYDRPLGQVGPVRPGYLCYHEKGKLVAIDPLTASRLWQRFDVPPGTISAGDDEVVLLYAPDSPRLEVLRAIDGKTLATRELPVLPREFLMQAGRSALLEEDGKGSGVAGRDCLVWYDLVTDRVVWRREFAAGTVPFAICHELVGAVEPDGTLHIIFRSSGKTLSAHRVAVPDRLLYIHAAADRHRFFVALSGPLGEDGNLRLNQQRTGFRAPPMNGPLCGFDRRTGALLWQTALRDMAFALDQPKDAPFLLLDALRIVTRPDETEDTAATLHILDKRTGGQIFEHTSTVYFGAPMVEANLDDKWIDLKLLEQTTRFEYGR